MDFSLKYRQSDVKRQHKGVPKDTQPQIKKRKRLKNQCYNGIKKLKEITIIMLIKTETMAKPRPF
jgi:hypothetical protein